MPQLKDREKRTIQIAAIGITLYLVLFYGRTVWSGLESTRTEYQQLVQEARTIEDELRTYENNVLFLKDLEEQLQLDLSELNQGSLVADASAALQEAARSSGFDLGQIRESGGSAEQLASIQIQGKGKIDSLIKFLHQIKALGYPVLLESLQITANIEKRNEVEAAFTVAILNFEHWQQQQEQEEANQAETIGNA